MDELDLGWQIIGGNNNVLFVAGHNFEQGRKGMIKFAEWGTGEIVRIMCNKYKSFGLISTKKQVDPNWYFESPFREKIREMVKDNKIGLIVDIHGSGMQNDELVYLRGNKLFVEKYQNLLGDWKIRKFVDNNQLTLAEEYNSEIPTIEIEIREDGRIRTIDENNYNKVQNLIIDLINKIL